MKQVPGSMHPKLIFLNHIIGMTPNWAANEVGKIESLCLFPAISFLHWLYLNYENKPIKSSFFSWTSRRPAHHYIKNKIQYKPSRALTHTRKNKHSISSMLADQLACDIVIYYVLIKGYNSVVWCVFPWLKESRQKWFKYQT